MLTSTQSPERLSELVSNFERETLKFFDNVARKLNRFQTPFLYVPDLVHICNCSGKCIEQIHDHEHLRPIGRWALSSSEIQRDRT